MANRMKLSVFEAEALETIRGGAPVFRRRQAVLLLELHKKRPGIMKIVHTKDMQRRPGDPRPYFGAILTAKGEDLLTRWKDWQARTDGGMKSSTKRKRGSGSA